MIIQCQETLKGFNVWNWFLSCFSNVFVCFSNVFPSRKEVVLASLLSDDVERDSSRIRYSYFSILPQDNEHVFAATLLMSYCNLSSLILSLIVMVTLYSPYNRFLQKIKALSDGRALSVTKNKYESTVKFLYSLLNSWKSRWIISSNCWSCRLFGIFMIKKCVLFNLNSLAIWSMTVGWKPKK